LKYLIPGQYLFGSVFLDETHAISSTFPQKILDNCLVFKGTRAHGHRSWLIGHIQAQSNGDTNPICISDAKRIVSVVN